MKPEKPKKQKEWSDLPLWHKGLIFLLFVVLLPLLVLTMCVGQDDPQAKPIADVDMSNVHKPVVQPKAETKSEWKNPPPRPSDVELKAHPEYTAKQAATAMGLCLSSYADVTISNEQTSAACREARYIEKRAERDEGFEANCNPLRAKITINTGKHMPYGEQPVTATASEFCVIEIERLTGIRIEYK